MNASADFEPPLDVEAAALENQLLSLEVQVLRGRLKAAEEAARAGAPAAGSVAVDRRYYEDLKLARSNLRWLLGRLGTGPLGWVLRRKKGFRQLEERWVSTERRGVS